MTPQEVSKAIELAYETLEKRSSTWRDREALGQWLAELWEGVLVSDTLHGIPIIDGGQTRIVLEMRPKSEDAPDSYEMYSDERGAELIDRAINGDAAANNVLCGIAADYLERGRELPDHLRGFAVVTLRALGNVQSSRRGRDPYANYPRNFDVACTILKVMSLGFRPTRNRATETESACSIVRQALEKSGVHRSEAMVEKIWERFSARFR